ncbi:hypothetical protein ACI6QG_08530 [Roseococcus sp. DSY-14]|uniref:hypothetical protein n=1 Tax=Roseococcus sp. DSY-14 TaxID=3369650 RepID=UPI00387AD3E9
MRNHLQAVLLLGGVAAAAQFPTAAARADELLHLPAAGGVALLASAAPGAPLVLLLPDAAGEDGRAAPYADALALRGFAVLTLGLDEEHAPDAATVRAALAWAVAHGHRPAGLVGWGAGAGPALSAGLPGVAMYPGCAALAGASGPALALRPHDAPRCAASWVEQRFLLGAGHGWDVPGDFWPMGGVLLPDPEGGPRLRAAPDPGLTERVATAVADWLVVQLAELP